MVICLCQNGCLAFAHFNFSAEATLPFYLVQVSARQVRAIYAQ